MKYDSSIVELKGLLPTAKNILIVLPAGSNIDKLAAGLALFLTFESLGKQVSIVCDDNIMVGQAHLFGVDHIQKNISSTGGGNLTLTLEGVAASDNTVPALEKLDWFAESSNLNLVFHVLPGQTFQPARIVPHYLGSGFNLIFTIGAVNLNSLGNVYNQNPQIFSGTHLVNIDIQVGNTSFGQTNVVDTASSSLSEVMTNLISDLGLNLDADTASNLLAGIFEATANLSANASADTFMIVANCLRAGGKKPGVLLDVQQSQSVPPQQPAYDWSALMPASPAQRGEPKQPTQPQPESVIPDFAMPPVVENATQTVTSSNNQPSPEELPSGERVTSETIEPEWLTPKIFKGSSLG